MPYLVRQGNNNKLVDIYKTKPNTVSNFDRDVKLNREGKYGPNAFIMGNVKCYEHRLTPIKLFISFYLLTAIGIG